MWTISYKGFFIHGYCHKDEVSVTYTGMAFPQHFTSLHAAKCHITRYLNSQE